jgi:hypothetical protein
MINAILKVEQIKAFGNRVFCDFVVVFGGTGV